MKKAVCLISGGMDSFVSAAKAKKDGYKLLALSVNYGQKNNRELDFAHKIALFLGAEKHITLEIDLSWANSALTDRNIKIPESTSPESIPSTYVPARNTIFISLAMAFAETAEAKTIYTGINAVDFSGYPDCRPEYVRRFQALIDIATKKTVEGNNIKLETPLINKSKSEIIAMGTEMGVDFSITWSCYRNGRTPCGRCPSCIIRAKGFKDAHIKDPLLK